MKAARKAKGEQADILPKASPLPPIPDPLGDLLIAKGFVYGPYQLEHDGTISVPHDMELSEPWRQPSRLFRFPIEVSRIVRGTDEIRRIGLLHPLLADHPFVLRVEEAIGFKINPDGAPNEYGVSHQNLGQWWHAVDLMDAWNWEALLETRRFTTDAHIMRAVEFAMQYKNRITTKVARHILGIVDCKEPQDRLTVLKATYEPSPCRQDDKSIHWPINSPHHDPDGLHAWRLIFGIEEGWFGYFRGRYLQWTESRDQFQARQRPYYVESKTGQIGFAF